MIELYRRLLLFENTCYTVKCDQGVTESKQIIASVFLPIVKIFQQILLPYVEPSPLGGNGENHRRLVDNYLSQFEFVLSDEEHSSWLTRYIHPTTTLTDTGGVPLGTKIGALLSGTTMLSGVVVSAVSLLPVGLALLAMSGIGSTATIVYHSQETRCQLAKFIDILKDDASRLVLYSDDENSAEILNRWRHGLDVLVWQCEICFERDCRLRGVTSCACKYRVCSLCFEVSLPKGVCPQCRQVCCFIQKSDNLVPTNSFLSSFFCH
jgi:hypothetical protein